MAISAASPLSRGRAAWWRMTGSNPPLSARRTAPLVEPGAVFAHFRALCGGRVPLAGRRLVAPLRRAPAQLDAVVEIIGHLERRLPGDHILERKRRSEERRVGKVCR